MDTVARLYTSGSGRRRCRRASVMPGPGQALVLREDVERLITRVLPVLDAACAYKPVGMAAGDLARDLRTMLSHSHVGSSTTADAVLPEEPTQAQPADACLWEAHDFGLCDDAERRRRMASMRDNWRAIWKVINTPGRGQDHAPQPDAHA
jgi:hypothetical protein